MIPSDWRCLSSSWGPNHCKALGQRWRGIQPDHPDHEGCGFSLACGSTKLCGSKRFPLAHLSEGMHVGHRNEKYRLPGSTWAARRISKGRELPDRNLGSAVAATPSVCVDDSLLALPLSLGSTRAALEAWSSALVTTPTLLVDKHWCLKTYLYNMNQPCGLFPGDCSADRQSI